MTAERTNKLQVRTCVFLGALVACAAALANHSFTVTKLGFTETSVTIQAQPTAASALLEMEARVCDEANTTTYVGTSHTFTSVGESFTFNVDVPAGAFGNGDNVLISVTDSLGSTNCNAGAQGYLAVHVVSIAQAIPVMSPVAMGILVLLLAGLAALTLVRARS